MTAHPRSDRLRTGALLLLALWATGLSLESWFRRPGLQRPQPFPPQLLRGRVIYERRPPAANHQPLPDGLEVLEAADYQAPSAPRLALRWLTLTSSGSGVNFPLEKVAPAVLGPGGRGVCQLADRPGTTAPLLHSPAELNRALAATAPRGAQWWLWLAGLRPYRSNACLWIGGTATEISTLTSPPSSSAPRPSPPAAAR
jgi:hypothetical protein